MNIIAYAFVSAMNEDKETMDSIQKSCFHGWMNDPYSGGNKKRFREYATHVHHNFSSAERREFVITPWQVMEYMQFLHFVVEETKAFADEDISKYLRTGAYLKVQEVLDLEMQAWVQKQRNNETCKCFCPKGREFNTNMYSEYCDNNDYYDSHEPDCKHQQRVECA